MAKTEEVIKLIRRLRKECPWDRKRKLKDLVNSFIEESYELLAALEDGDREKISEEIGDLLFLGLMAVVIAEEEIKIDPNQLYRDLIEKYVRRHPHVFGDAELKNGSDVLRYWERHKKRPFSDIPKVLPALVRARLIQERASRFGFDWEDVTGPIEKVKEEVAELTRSDDSSREVEFGDLLFSLVNVARFLKIDPETALAKTCDKFQRRFQRVIERAGPDADLEEMDRIWEDLKDE
ncbi:nucleoside triphosphate pyrophosphohydrolase [candidate division WOR-3 bacterium]|uniref:Nucleoside triphosphate pyrophosphohydrolase n=1 Tax=candidate division WOR-3 bacterium TaxID=2052148 RepID=A0A660SHY9_UNCW3|nr:MAG: nucleoside triphosphate pyrophosphohydrolase [candidate division WOR-3 bacterium]